MGSFEFDFSQLLDSASDIFNAFSPLFLGIAGISLGFGLIIKVVSEVRRAL
jgi:hypothetical protein